MTSQLNQDIAQLNHRQQEAVYSDPDRPTLITAGAGTGKTKTLICRAGHLILDRGLEPQHLLMVTFTRKATEETRQRLTATLGEDIAKKVNIGNFHSIGCRMLRAMPSAAGFLHNQFSIIDEHEQEKIIGSLAWQEGMIGEKPRMDYSPERNKILRLQASINRWKEAGMTPQDVHTRYGTHQESQQNDALRLYPLYQETLRHRILCDFGDLLLLPLDAMRRDPKIRAHWQNYYSHIQVDEYQDTNYIQKIWLQTLSAGPHRLFAIGDPDQSMYRWRGANPRIMTNFAEDWPNAQILTLEQNYRSTQSILDPANKIVAKNKRIEKNLSSAKNGEKPIVHSFPNDEEESQFIAESILSAHEKGVSYNEMAVLTRNRYIFPNFERVFEQHGIPYTSSNEQDLLKCDDIRDVLALIRFGVNPSDENAFERILYRLSETLSDHDIWMAITSHRGDTRKTTLYEICNDLSQSGHVPAEQAQDFKDMSVMLERIHNATLHQNGASIGDLILTLLDVSSYSDRRKRLDPRGDDPFTENIKNLIAFGEEYTDYTPFHDALSLNALVHQEHSTHAVSLMTVHAAKGLEFHTVFAPASEEGIIPSPKALRSSEGIEEERNIAHVLWTRAKEHLVISWAETRQGRNKSASRFLFESGLLDEKDQRKTVKKRYDEGRILSAEGGHLLIPAPIRWIQNPYPNTQ